MPNQARRAAIPFYHSPLVNEEDGGRALPFTFDFASDTTQEISMPLSDIGLFSFQTLYVDNGSNSNACTITIRGTNQRIIVRPNSQGYYPVLGSPQSLDFIISADSGITHLLAINIAMVGQVDNWSGTFTPSITNPNGTVEFPFRIISNGGVVGQISDYPDMATSIHSSSGNVANASAVATLIPTAGRTAFLCGLELTASGATAGLPVIATVTGLLGGTKSIIFTFPAGVLVAALPIIIAFPHPLRASAVDVNIVVTLPAGGAGNTNAVASAHGYHL